MAPPSGTTANPNVMVIGLPGVGKSSFLESEFGAAVATARQATAVTTETKSFQATWKGRYVTVWDTCGALDQSTPFEQWLDELTKAAGTSVFQQMILMVNATVRVNIGDAVVAIALTELFQEVSFSEGITVVFTHCDAAPQAFDSAWRANWVSELNKLCRFEDEGLEPLDTSKTLAFVPQKHVAEMSEVSKAAAAQGLSDALGSSAADVLVDVGGAIGEAAAKVVLPAVAGAAGAAIPQVTPEMTRRVVNHLSKAIGPKATKKVTGGGKCFHRDSPVFLRTSSGHQRVDVGSLRIGDRILCYDESISSFVDDEIVWLFDHSKEVGAKGRHVLVFTLVFDNSSPQGISGKTRLALDHYAIRETSDGVQVEAPVQSVNVGDYLFVYNEDSLVRCCVSQVDKDVASMSEMVHFLTARCSPVVDNVVSSCKTMEWDSSAGRFAHKVLAKFPGLGRYLQEPLYAYTNAILGTAWARAILSV